MAGDLDMKKLLMSVAALAALAAAPAIAADIPVKAPPRAAPPVVSWTGFYVGIDGGYARGDTDWTFPTTQFWAAAGQGFDVSPRGGMLGFHAGYNYQFSQFVLGIEGSYAFTSMIQHLIGPVPPFASDNHSLEVRNLASVTGRLGLVWGNSLIYGKGGWATGEVEIQSHFSNVNAEASSRLNGWTAGGGVEYMLAPNWIVGVEYNHYRLSGEGFSGATTVGGVFLAPYLVNIGDVRINSVVGRMSYKF